MRNKSLNFKLMIAFVGVILFFSIISYTLLVRSFQNYYQEDIYKVLEENNSKKSSRQYNTIDEFIESSEDIRSIEQLSWIKKGNRFIRRPKKAEDQSITEEVLSQIEANIRKQKDNSKRYDMTVNGRRLFYVVDKYTMEIFVNPRVVKTIQNATGIKRKSLPDNSLFYTVSLRWEPLDNTLEYQLYTQLGMVLIATAVATLIIFYVLSRHLTQPLNQLTRSLKRISNRKFDVPISLNRSDEIGFLASTIEEMRRDLLTYDEEQKLKLHSISHELKTPIMIIQSYVDALKRGMHPKGSPEASLGVIEEECNRLERLVANLLYIQRLDYIDTEIKHKEHINLQDAVHEVLDNMAIKLTDFNVSLELENIRILADSKQIKIIIENIMSNQIRYAKSDIRVTLYHSDGKATLEIYNDGEAIKDVEHIFKMFKKGEKGQSGLGLYIVKRLVAMSKGQIQAINEEVGVTFRIEWPMV